MSAWLTYKSTRSPFILPYRGFGNKDYFYIKGRVLKKLHTQTPSPRHGFWDNLKYTFYRYIPKHHPYAYIKVSYKGIARTTTADKKGEFNLRLPLHELKMQPEPGWHQLTLTLLDKDQNEIGTPETGEVLVPEPACHFGVISDIDDTLLVSHSNKFFKRLYLLLFKNAHTRVPFEGVTAFYRALEHGPEDKTNNPVFYVSSSEWNLYDLIIEFCNHHHIPKGPLMLHRHKHLQNLRPRSKAQHHHKTNKIRHLFKIYPDINFILIGDSGQQDAEIYEALARQYPDRIKAIYIRDVGSEKRHRQVQTLASRAETNGVPMILVNDTETAAYHALEHGFITEEALQAIHLQKYHDHHNPSEWHYLIRKYWGRQDLLKKFSKSEK